MKGGDIESFPTLTPDQLNPEQMDLWNELTGGTRGFFTGGVESVRLPDLYNAWLQFPAFGWSMLRLADAIRAQTELTGRHRELVILTASARFDAWVEFDFHVPFALDQGLSNALIEALRAETVPAFEDTSDKDMYDATIQIMNGAKIERKIYRRILEKIGYSGIMQFIATVVLYVATAYIINAASVKLARDFSADPSQLKKFFSGQ